MNVLLLWEIIPSTSDLYLIENPTPEELKILEKASGYFIGGDEDEALFKLSDMLTERDDWCYTPGAPHNGKWSKLEKQTTPFKGKFDMFVLAGVIC